MERASVASNHSHHDHAVPTTANAARGFTLIEMVLSLSLFGIVLVSLGTMLALTMQAAPKSSDAATLIRNASYPATVMAEELAAAIQVISVTPTEITFRTADRTGNGQPDTVTYSWSGKPGTPLTRKVNASDSVELISSLESAFFAADIQTHTQITNFATSSSAFQHELSPGSSLVGSITALLNSRLERLRIGQGFFQCMSIEAVPDDALYWVPEYAEVLLQRNSSPGTIRLELHVEENHTPTGVAVISKVLQAADLDREEWVRISVPGTLKLSPQTRLGVMVVCLSGDGSVETRIMNQILFPSAPPARSTSDGGASWDTKNTTRMAYRLRGSYYERGKQESASESTIRSIRFSINPTAASATAISTSIDLAAPVRYGP